MTAVNLQAGHESGVVEAEIAEGSPDPSFRSRGAPTPDRGGSLASLVSVQSRHPSWQRAAKRFGDLAFVIITAPLALVVMAVAVPLIVVVDRQRPFYTDPRVGRGGRRFGCFKLRTMRAHDAEFATYLEENPDERLRWVESRKVDYDPRVTRLGAVLRHASLDEVPQLLNVLIGSMSLVGPRPLSEREYDAHGLRINADTNQHGHHRGFDLRCTVWAIKDAVG